MIEIKGFLETSFLDWPGKLCSVIFFPRCNFRCPYCHNHSLVFHPEQYAAISSKDIFARLHSLRKWIDGVCLTGGEPTLHAGIPHLIREIKEKRFLVKLDTNGSNPRMLGDLVAEGAVDFVSMDVKAPLDPFRYSRTTGTPINLKPILESIEILKRGNVEYQFRMTVVPGLHQEEDIKALGEQLMVGGRFILQNFNPENPMDPSLKSIVPYDSDALKKIEREVQKMEPHGQSPMGKAHGTIYSPPSPKDGYGETSATWSRFHLAEARLRLPPTGKTRAAKRRRMA